MTTRYIVAVNRLARVKDKMDKNPGTEMVFKIEKLRSFDYLEEAKGFGRKQSSFLKDTEIIYVMRQHSYEDKAVYYFTNQKEASI